MIPVVDGFYWLGGFGASNFIQFRDGTNYAQHSTIQNCAINGLSVNPDDFEVGTSVKPVSYTHLTLPTTPYV